jgi:hypothetical protein
MKSFSPTIHIQEEPFLVSKTSDTFHEVRFVYDQNKIWAGCVPNTYKELSLQMSLEEVCSNLEKWYEELRYENRGELKRLAIIKWGDSSPENTETGRVFLKLLQGNNEWVCRTCGTGKINDQPAARIRDIKKRGYIIATKTRPCSTCNIRTYQDMLILLSINADKRPEFRQPIDMATRKKIINVLNSKDAVFDVVRTSNEFVIDHKFPSQRWDKFESRNHIDMSEDTIRAKFQLLTNQTNMLKSRFCDDCVKTGNRATFMGISWYYSGSAKWGGPAMGNELGCKGCPWYDVVLWRKMLAKKL